MIEKMRKDVAEHDQSGGQPDLPDADAAQPRGKRGLHGRSDVTDSGGLCRHVEPSSGFANGVAIIGTTPPAPQWPRASDETRTYAAQRKSGPGGAAQVFGG
jgi:hypothetical protein